MSELEIMEMLLETNRELVREMKKFNENVSWMSSHADTLDRLNREAYKRGEDALKIRKQAQRLKHAKR